MVMAIDYGTILIFIIIGAYYITRYNKNKKDSYFVLIFMAITGIFYKQSHGMYNNVGKSAQIFINIIYFACILILLIVGFINKKSKRKKTTQ
jgi:RsiW-degrading membrane proteinase PrsW (M82 family)